MIEGFHHPKSNPVSLAYHPPVFWPFLLQKLLTYFLSAQTLLFWITHKLIDCVFYYVAFCVCLFVLTVIFQGSPIWYHESTLLSFSWLNAIYIVSISHIFICPFGVFNLLASVQNAAVNNCVQIFEYTIGVHFEIEFLGQVESLCLIFLVFYWR